MFGNSANANGHLNAGWEHLNIITAAPPAGWHLYYQDEHGGLLPTAGIRIHRLLHDSFREVLTEVWGYARTQVKETVGYDKTTAEYDELTRAWLHERRLDQHVGGFSFRNVTAGQGLSMHAYGIAIDWDGRHNPRGNPMVCTLPDWWYEIWSKHGWTNGKHFHTADPMHVQFATGV